jgi:hypothetical protein
LAIALPVTVFSTERRQEHPGQPAHGEQANKAHGVEHGRGIGHGAFVHRRGPIEYFDGRRNGDQEAQKRENHAGVHGLSGNEHVVA